MFRHGLPGHVVEWHAVAVEIVNPTRPADVTRRKSVIDKGCQHFELDQQIDVGDIYASLMGHLLARIPGHETDRNWSSPAMGSSR